MDNNINELAELPTISICDELLVSSPDNGGLSYISGDLVMIIDAHASTGLFVDQTQLIRGYQENGGRSISVIRNGKYWEIELSKSPLDIHDILFDNGQLFAVITENNAVTQFDNAYQTVNSWQLPGENDSAHINSIASYNGQLIASIFGRFETHRGYKGGTSGQGQIINLISGETYIDCLSQPHSLTVIDEQLYLCSSEDMELHVYDGYELKTRITLPGYARGICAGKDHIYVGISISRNIDSDKHQHSKGSIIVIDKKSMTPIGMRQIPFREVYDIRLVHNHQNVMAAVKHSRSNHDTRVLELQETLDSRNTSVEQLQTGIGEYEASNQQLQAGIREYEASNQQLQAGIREYEASNQQLQTELSKILASPSWRITKPLRFIEQLLKSCTNKT